MHITTRHRTHRATWGATWLTSSPTCTVVLITLLSPMLSGSQTVTGLRHSTYLGELSSGKLGLGMSSLMWPQKSGGIVENEEDPTVLKGGSLEEEGIGLPRNRRADLPDGFTGITGRDINDTDDGRDSSGGDSGSSEAPPPATDAPTEAPSNVTEAPTETPTEPPTGAPATDPAPTQNATVASNSTAPPPTASGLFSNANISTIYDKNYSYVDQTTFVSGMNGWDFEGIWLKSNLETMDEDARPVPLPHPSSGSRVEGGNRPGGALGGLGKENEVGMPVVNATNVTLPEYVNNYVIIDYSFLAGGVLRKIFPAMDFGEIFLSYYVIDATMNFKLTLESSALSQPIVLYADATASPRPVGQWVVRYFNFTANASKDFALVVTVDPPAVPSGDRKPLLAVHHIAVGGNLSDVGPTTPPTGSNATIIPPGAMEPIREIASAIWTALYVFLAFFLLSILGLIVLIMRGRCSQTGSASRSSDYNPDTSYRLDKVYDNPSYDASSP